MKKFVASARAKARKLLKPTRRARRSRMTHDVQLMKRVKKRRIPTFRQFLSMGQVLQKKEKLIFFVAVVVFVISFFWSGNVISNNYRVEVPKVAGSYVEGVIGGVQLINPIYASLNDVDQDISRLVYSGLMRYDEQRELVADIAARYDVSEDNKTYTFELKQHVLFHDGEKLTADDIVYTFDMIQDDDVGSPLSVAFQDVVVSRVDDYTVRFELAEPFPSFLSTMTIGVLPEHIWSLIPRDQMRLANRNLQPIGAGPFMFDNLVKDASGFIHRVELKRFEDFYRNAPYIKNFAFEFFSDYEGPSGMITALREQKIDGINFVPFELREKVRRKNITLHTLQLPQYTSLFFNLSSDELEESDVRIALTQALDKQRIVSDVLENEARVIDGPILEGFPGYNNDIIKREFLSDTANTALDEYWARVGAQEYRDLLVEERLETAIEAAAPAVEPAPAEETDEGVDDEAGDQQNDEASAEEISEESQPVEEVPAVNTDEIRQSVEQEVDLELDEAQLFYRYPDGTEDMLNILELDLVTVSTPEYVKVAELIAGYWQDVGIKVNVRLVDAKDLAKEVLKDRDYDVLLYGVIIGNDPDQYPFWHSSQIGYPGLNLSQYNNEDVDTLLEDIRETTDDEELKNSYVELQNTILEDVPAAFLYTPTYTYALTNKVKGFTLERISHPSDRFSTVTDWYLSTRRVWKLK